VTCSRILHCWIAHLVPFNAHEAPRDNDHIGSAGHRSGPDVARPVLRMARDYIGPDECSVRRNDSAPRDDGSWRTRGVEGREHSLRGAHRRVPQTLSRARIGGSDLGNCTVGAIKIAGRAARIES